jgi:NodT family efflux transporter outer membrane factor (OMF) lipoprotein
MGKHAIDVILEPVAPHAVAPGPAGVPRESYSRASTSGLRPLLLAGIALLGAAGLAGCTVGPQFERPRLAATAGYTPEKLVTTTASADVAGGAAQHLVVGAEIPGEWWALFHSKSLDTLVNEALAANPDVAAAQAALRQAQETLYSDEGSLFPTVSGTGSATREKISGAAFGNPRAPSPTLTVTSASLSVSYAPDVWGGVRRQVEAASAEAEYEQFELEATDLTLTSSVANAAVTLASLRDQIAGTEDILEVETEQLDLLKKQYRLGAISQSSVLTQQAALAQTRATLPPLQKQLAQTRNELMTYLGRFPNQYRGDDFDLSSLTLVQQLPVSLPSKLVEQRPDVLAAEAQLHQASANIGVAIANQLPQFTLTGTLGDTSTGLDKIFSPSSGVWSLAGSVAQTLFDGGALEHRKRAAVAAYDEAADHYRSVVLSAFQDVANALRALQSDADALNADVIAEQAARGSFDLARHQYQLGAIDYLTLLNAQQTWQNAVLTRIRAQATRYSDTVALFQALGGGWWNRRDVPPADARPVRFVLPPIDQIHLPGTR